MGFSWWKVEASTAVRIIPRTRTRTGFGKQTLGISVRTCVPMAICFAAAGAVEFLLQLLLLFLPLWIDFLQKVFRACPNAAVQICLPSRVANTTPERICAEYSYSWIRATWYEVASDERCFTQRCEADFYICIVFIQKAVYLGCSAPLNGIRQIFDRKYTVFCRILEYKIPVALLNRKTSKRHVSYNRCSTSTILSYSYTAQICFY